MQSRGRLFRLDDTGLQPLPTADGTEITGSFQIIDAGGGNWLLGTNRIIFNDLDGGVYHIGTAQLTRLQVIDGSAPSDVSEIVYADDGTWLIGADTGLFRLYSVTVPEVLSNETRLDGRKGLEHSFEWRIRHSCAAVLPQSGLFGVRYEGGEWASDVIVQPPEPGQRDEARIVWRHQITAMKGEKVLAELGFRAHPELDFQPIGPPYAEVKIDYSVWDDAKEIAGWLLLWVAAGQTALFGTLLVAARRSRWAWSIVTDPNWGKLGIQFWTLLRFWPALQRRLMARWMDALRDRYPARPYLPMPLAGPENAEIMSTNLVGMLSPGKRFWLQGAAGMGKTVLIDRVIADYCDGSVDLAAAFARWKYVPVPIALRDFADIKMPDKPEEWLLELVGRRLESAGLRIEDERLLRGIVAAGYMVLVLDGANEVDDRGSVQQFAQRFTQVGMLVTSQIEPSNEAAELFDLWRLPPDIRDAAKPLLELDLGEERGREVWGVLKDSQVMSDIRSGYDVRLIAGLVEGGMAPDEIPSSRLGLYDKMLGLARNRDGTPYPVARLCGVAWKTWVAGRRDLVPSDNMPGELLAPLRDQAVRLVATQDGTRWQFRHDQMRGYLAARWAAIEEVSPMDLFKKTPDVWRLERSEQRIVWEFFADLIGAKEGSPVLDWSTLAVERAELQVALRSVAQSDGWLMGSPEKR